MTPSKKEPIMKNLRLLALAATVCLAASAQASVVLNFNMPALVGFNPDGTQTLVEQGYQLNGPQFSFLPIDNAGNGVIVGDGTPFSLQQVGGGIFSLLSLGYAFDDIFGSPAGDLNLFGLFNGTQVASRTLSLGSLASSMFDNSWTSLTSVRFSATSGFSIDNVNVAAVPEPGSLALAVLALGALVAGGRRAGAARAS